MDSSFYSTYDSGDALATMTLQKSYSLYWQTIDRTMFFCYILYKLIIIE